jgi:hypothetical protein
MQARNFRYLIALSLVGLSSCSHGGSQSGAAPAVVAARTPRKIETFTGEVIKVAEGYRFKPANDPNNLQRFTRAKKSGNYVYEELNLRKYFGKTLVVSGESVPGWLLEVNVVGQWLRPGEPRGSTLTGPEPPAR